MAVGSCPRAWPLGFPGQGGIWGSGARGPRGRQMKGAAIARPAAPSLAGRAGGGLIAIAAPGPLPTPPPPPGAQGAAVPTLAGRGRSALGVAALATAAAAGL